MDKGNNNQPQKQDQPQNVEAEASLLGAVLIDPDALIKIADTVGIEDFYDAPTSTSTKPCWRCMNAAAPSTS